MIVIAGLLGGAIIGAFQAKRRGGRAMDMLQYGAGYAIFLSLVGLLLTIVIDRMT
ncbi:hypothetical protein [Falsirhodobacter xinxiangensis]|uniref:hypothetical protein n=1 Tax=Falsirhodobacter xinxiangensis TaxID=2530049 RepID=UPI00145AEDF4|nr:hypothetical protein [Rhodobacter xinxiangensis]